MNRRVKALAKFGLLMLFTTASLNATPYTPLSWQRVVDSHWNPVFIGQRKHLTWIRDQNRNFIDDEIERQFRPGDRVNVIVDLNRCLTPGEVQEVLSRFGVIDYIGKLVTFVLLNGVGFTDLPALAARPEVAMVEWRAPDVPELDVASRAIQTRKSGVYAGLSAEEVVSPLTGQPPLTGKGINIAIVDSGVDDGVGTYASLPATKFVAGFDATDPNDPGDGLRNPTDASNHGSTGAAIALGVASPGRTCRTPDPGSVADCAGVAPGAGLIDIKMWTPTYSNAEKALDWVGLNAQKFKIRIVNYAFTRCGDSDGTEALAEQANYLAATGLVFVASYGNSGVTCNNVTGNPGDRLTKAPGSASFVMAVTGSDDKGTVSRTDDTVWSNYLAGPRKDFSCLTPDPNLLLALKPDLAAPQNVTYYKSGTTYITQVVGTTPAAAVVSGAAALILEKFPSMNPESVKQLLFDYADRSRNTNLCSTTPGPWDNWDKGLGWGLLNVGGAINAAVSQSTNVRFSNCKTPSATGAGQLCELRDGKPAWNNETDISTTMTPKVNVQTQIVAKVTNDGPNTATFLVSFGVYVFATGNNRFHHIGTKQKTLNPGQADTVTIDWTPAAADHQCVQVTIAYGLDSDYTDNVTQRNILVSASVYDFRVENPFPVPARFEVKATSDRAGWRCEVSDRAFTLDPFTDCAKDVKVTFDPPLGVRPGEQATCNVAVRGTPQGGERRLIGGVTVRTYVPRPCRVYGQIVDRAGRPVRGARVTFRRVLSGAKEQRPPVTQTKAASFQKREISVVTDGDGVFSVFITPEVLQTLSVEKAGVGKGKLTLRPACGLGLPRLVLGPKGLQETTVRSWSGTD